MKIEVEVDDALIQALGEEVVKNYLSRKASQLALSLQTNTGRSELTENDTDQEAIQKAWTQFNKRGSSC